ncbi:MAG: enoyl-CoA hydratase/isomerase family protein [Pseudomonadota bacterium]
MPAAESDVILVERDADIVTVTLNRPDKLNALNAPMWKRLGEVIRGLEREDRVGCIVLRGAGEKAFAPGADIAEFETMRNDPRQAAAYGKLMHAAMHALRDCRHPSVAMIHGLCVGGGLELASMCDLRIAGQSSRFGVPINRIGVIMAYPELEAFIDLVGRAAALEILLEGRVFGAAEAKEKGLVNRVVPDAEVVKETYAAARRIADGAPLCNRWHKKFARRLADPRPLTGRELEEGYACFDTEDFREGTRAFLAKRKPVFKGR